MKENRKTLCLVTGGAGFIGSHLTEALLNSGYRVRVLDDLSSGSLHNLKPVFSKIEWRKGSLTKDRDIQRSVRGVDYIFHVAAKRAVLRSVDRPMETNEVNVTGTLRLLVAARDARVRRLIFSSSSSVYGDTKKFPCQEDDRPSPQSPYAASKVMGEYYCRIFSSVFGLETVSLRYFNVFGPRQNPESRYSTVIPLFIKSLHGGTRPEVHWDGRQSRDFSYVDNVVHGNLLAMKKPGIAGQVFNIACHEEYDLLEILGQLQRILKVPKVRPVFKPKRAGDVRRTFADIRKAQRLLGYRVQTRFPEGLRKTVDWFLKEWF